MATKTQKVRIIFATKGEYIGHQRKLAWFSRHEKDLYFEISGFFMGSHTSYHRDGNIFRTSRATNNRPNFLKKHLPLNDFEGWHQFGISMIRKEALAQNPPLKSRDRKSKTILKELDLNFFPSNTINFIIELLSPDSKDLLNSDSVAPPTDAIVFIIDDIVPWLILTVLGHDHNLLIKPKDQGVICRHFNSRFTASYPGRKYGYEAYLDD